jgi:zinc transporter
MPSPGTTTSSQEQHAELIHAYLFKADGIGQELDAQAALDWLRNAGNETTEFIWLHFSSPHNIGKRWLEYVELPQIFKEVLHEERRSSRLAHSHHGLFAVINDVTYDPTRRTEPLVATLWLSIRQRWLLSAWSAPVRPVEQLIATIEGRRPFRNPLALLIQLLSNQADVLVDIVRSATITANNIEGMLAVSHLPRRADLGGIRRDLVRLQRLLAPEPASLFRLVNRLPHWAKEEDSDYLHLATENFSVALRDMAGLQERIKLLEDEIAARVAERTNRGVFVLTSATVIALPVTVISALFGMNVGGLPFRESSEGFAAVVGISILVSVLAAWLITRLLKD